MRVSFAAFALAALFAVPAFAADAPAPRKDLKETPSGVYELDPMHTNLGWRVNHLGFSYLLGRFAAPSGTLKLDAAKPEQSSIDITIETASITTASSELAGKLLMADFFDAKKFPKATFVSKRVRATGPGEGAVEGELTLHGVTKPVTLKTELIGAGQNPFAKSAALGFHATTTINRSDFGIGAYVPMVSDAVELTIDTEFHQVKKD